MVVDERDEARRIRARTRWFLGGLAVGVALGFAVTAVQVASKDYVLLDAPRLLVLNLISAPYLGVITGLFGLIRTRRRGPRVWNLPQFRIRTLMVVVAYLALLFVGGISSHRLSMITLQYHLKANSSANLSNIYRELGLQSEADAKLRRENVAGLRAGEIPVGLMPTQLEFLRSLEGDAKVTPPYRQYRRDLITDGEEKHETRQEHNAAYLLRLGEYFENLAAKYDQARLRPWLPVEPDPPVPISYP
jgi:hypothetical protein